MIRYRTPPATVGQREHPFSASIFAIILVLAAVPFPATANDPEEDGDWVSTRRLSADFRSGLAGSLASGDPMMRDRALDTLASLASRGRIDPDDRETIEVVAAIATEGTATRVVGAAGNPEERRRAAYILGNIGGQTAQDELFRLIYVENDPYVLAEAVLSLARFEPKDEMRLLPELTGLLDRLSADGSDDNLALAVITAIGTLHREGWGIRDPRLFQELVELIDAPFNATVRRELLALIEELRTFR